MGLGVGPIGAKQDNWRILSIISDVDCIDVDPLPVVWITVYTDLIEAAIRPLDSKVVKCDDGWSVDGEVSVWIIG
jgi:hypothetical protein